MSFPLSGQLCEIPPHPPAPRSSCEGTECQNGANCVDQGSRAVCQCLPGFGGPECEKLLSVNFVDRDTYLQFTDLQNWPRANITLQVGTQGTCSQEGVRGQGTMASGQSIRLHLCLGELEGTRVSQNASWLSGTQLELVWTVGKVTKPHIRQGGSSPRGGWIQKTKLARILPRHLLSQLLLGFCLQCCTQACFLWPEVSSSGLRSLTKGP